MASLQFRHTRGFGIKVWTVPLMWFLIFTLGIWLGPRDLSGSTTVLVVAGSLIVVLAIPAWDFARRIELSDKGVEAWTYVGRRVTIPWSELAEVRSVVAHPLAHHYRLLRFVSRRPLGRVAVTDYSPDFDGLVRALEERGITMAGPRLWERVLYQATRPL